MYDRDALLLAARKGRVKVSKILLRSMLLQALVVTQTEALTQRRQRLKSTLLVLRMRLNLPYDLIRLILCNNSDLRADLLAVLYSDYLADKGLSSNYWVLLKNLLPKENYSKTKKSMHEVLAKCQRTSLKMILNPQNFEHNFEKIFLSKRRTNQEKHHDTAKTNAPQRTPNNLSCTGICQSELFKSYKQTK